MTQTIDLLLTGGFVVTMNQEFTLIPNGAVAIDQDSIVAVGTAAELKAAYDAAEVVDCTGQVIMPGLVNAHTHVPMTLMRGLNDDLRLDVWLGYLMPVERHFVTPEFVKLGTRLACAEMIRSGVTTFADMYYFEEAIAEQTAAIGMRALLGQSVIVFPTPDTQTYEDGLALCRQFIENWNGHELIQPAVAPHAWYTATAEMLQACAALAQEYNVPVHTHISETTVEQENCHKQFHMTPVEWNEKNGILKSKLLAAHCVHISRQDMLKLKKAGAGIGHCPSSNLKLASGIAPVAEMLEVGCNVGVGTDGTASNNDLDMFEEMRLAALLGKVKRSDPTDLPAKQALELATIRGARAVHMDHLTGSLEVGKRADVIVVDMDGVHNWPHFYNNPDGVYSRLIYAAKSTDVAHVLCNGRWLMRGRELLTVDEQASQAEAAEVAARIDAFVQERESSTYNKLIILEGVERQEAYEVQIKLHLDDYKLLEEQLNSGRFTITKQNRYRQYDTYFFFDEDDPFVNRLRYREDNYINAEGKTTDSRSRLTLLGDANKDEFIDATMLSRSRYIAPATQSRRFYREYFEPVNEVEVHKDRLRWRLDYEGADIAVNLDQVLKPKQDGYFLEIKARTWSLQDAERKTKIISQLLAELNIDQSDVFHQEYVDLVLVDD